MKTPFRKKNTVNPDELLPLPRIAVINAIQFQLFDNGEKPGRGRSQHQMKLEVYCDGRLDLMKPYWVRVVPLLDEKVFIRWVEKAVSDKKITQAQGDTYRLWHETIVAEAAKEDIEFAKLGHIGNKLKNEYYPGQFIAVIKEKGGGLQVVVLNGENCLKTDKFYFDQHWVKGGSRRKFFGFYDPAGMYEAAKAEKERAAKVEFEALERRRWS